MRVDSFTISDDFLEGVLSKGLPKKNGYDFIVSGQLDFCELRTKDGGLVGSMDLSKWRVHRADTVTLIVPARVKTSSDNGQHILLDYSVRCDLRTKGDK